MPKKRGDSREGAEASEHERNATAEVAFVGVLNVGHDEVGDEPDDESSDRSEKKSRRLQSGVERWRRTASESHWPNEGRPALTPRQP